MIFPAITILLKSELPENLNFIHISLEELSNYTNIDYITLGLSILTLVFLLKHISFILLWWKNGYSNEVQKQLSQRLLLTYLSNPTLFTCKEIHPNWLGNLVSEVSTFQKLFSILELIFELFVLTSIIVLFITEPKGLSIIVLIISTISLIIYLFTYKRIKIWGKIRLSESNKYFQNVSTIGSLRDIILTGRENNFLYNHFSQKSILTKLQQKFALIKYNAKIFIRIFAVFAILSLTIFLFRKENL